MKINRWIFAVLAALIVLTVLPLAAAAASGQPGLVGMDVTCTVEPVFEFTLPPDATIRYPNTSVLVGQFSVGDLLLREGEQLSVELTPGTMAARSNTGVVLPYTVSFSPPAAVDENHIGRSYGVVVTLDPDVFDAATRTLYDADLLFQVRSGLTGEVIWQGITTVTARKAQPGGGGGDDDGDGDGDNGNGEAVPDTGDNTIPGEEVPQANPNTDGNAGQPDESISGEETPQAQPVPAFWWWWIPVAVLGALLLLLLLWLLLWRNVTVTVYGTDMLGQEEIIRTIRQLKRKQDEVVVELQGRHVRGGVSGMVELGESFARRMQGKTLTVRVDSERVFSTVIPADTNGRFRTGMISWME